MATSVVHPVVLFDGVCNLCNGAVRFMIKRDRRATLRFAPLQSEPASRLLHSLGATTPSIAPPDSMILIEGNQAFARSAAALRIARRLRFPWPALYAFIIVPRPLRDWLYDIIARNRYRWFGRRDQCMLPTVDTQARFLT